MLKSASLAEYKAAVLDVARGGAPMSPAVVRKVLAHFNLLPQTQPGLLTGREQAVVQGIVDGLSDKQVAHRMGLSPETVRTYVKRVYRKLQVSSRTELVSRVVRGN
ncbi:response regulator transcription factor [Hymenobacter gummosus]|uniref:Response regulator transcription factor n=1 Tax=Hymenobacter gummosus TaxID=1776032 RepID=A0A431TZZ4_9BACT|nr:response regulator transcription factor [Hymenobacter gummosus]RTQ48437.1 response regulator transcription factor [Hymenobacter gummosus]